MKTPIKAALTGLFVLFAHDVLIATWVCKRKIMPCQAADDSGAGLTLTGQWQVGGTLISGYKYDI